MSAPDLGGAVRASDAERERVAQLLQSAAAEGRLSPEEAGERLARASAAVYRGDLRQLIADLPVPVTPEEVSWRERRWGPGWWLWRAARVAFVVMLATAWWGFWTFRLLLFPLGLMALLFLTRPWRRWRYGAF